MPLVDPNLSLLARNMAVLKREVDRLRHDPQARFEEQWLPAFEDQKACFPLSALVCRLDDASNARAVLELFVERGLRLVPLRDGAFGDDGVLSYVHGHRPGMVEQYLRHGIGLSAVEGGLQMLLAAVRERKFAMARQLLAASDIESLEIALSIAIAHTALGSAIRDCWLVSIGKEIDEDARILGWQIANRWKLWMEIPSLPAPVVIAKMVAATLYSHEPPGANFMDSATLREVVKLAMVQRMPSDAFLTLNEFSGVGRDLGSQLQVEQDRLELHGATAVSGSSAGATRL